MRRRRRIAHGYHIAALLGTIRNQVHNILTSWEVDLKRCVCENSAATAIDWDPIACRIGEASELKVGIILAPHCVIGVVARFEGHVWPRWGRRRWGRAAQNWQLGRWRRRRGWGGGCGRGWCGWRAWGVRGWRAGRGWRRRRRGWRGWRRRRWGKGRRLTRQRRRGWQSWSKEARLHWHAPASLLIPRAQLEAIPVLISIKPSIIVVATFSLIFI